MLLNDDVVEIEKHNGICSPIFSVDKFSGLFFYPSNFSIKLSRSVYTTNDALSDFWY